MHKKMIALDLDGTLLNSESKLSDFTIDTIKKISALGHKIIITTGRPYRMAHTYYKQLELDTPMINFNGSLTHLPEKKWVDEQCLTLDKKYLLDMVANRDTIQADFIAGEYRNKFFITDPNEQVADPKLFGIESFQPENQFNPERVTSDPNCILFQTKAEDKYALADEMNQLNMDQKDLIAFGDEHNDTDMLALAGHGYAMKNASSVLLPYADSITDFTNNEDGVARQLIQLFL